MQAIDDSGPLPDTGERLGGFQLRVIGLCALIALLDGFDTQSVGFVAPVRAVEWEVSVALFGSIFAICTGAGAAGVRCAVRADAVCGD